MSDVREFAYKGKRVKVTIGKSARGKYIGIPDIEGKKVGGKEIGHGSDTADEAFVEAQRKAREIIDADG